MPTWWFCFFFFNWQVMTAVLFFLLWLIGPSINPIRQRIQCSLVFWIPLRGFRVPGTLYWILDLCQWNLDSGFQSSLGFWIPNLRIPGFLPPPPRDPPSKKKIRGFPNMGRFDAQGSFKMFACGQNKTRYRSGAYSSRRVASRRVAPIEPMLMTNIVPEAIY